MTTHHSKTLRGTQLFFNMDPYFPTFLHITDPWEQLVLELVHHSERPLQPAAAKTGCNVTTQGRFGSSISVHQKCRWQVQTVITSVWQCYRKNASEKWKHFCIHFTCSGLFFVQVSLTRRFVLKSREAICCMKKILWSNLLQEDNSTRWLLAGRKQRRVTCRKKTKQKWKMERVVLYRNSLLEHRKHILRLPKRLSVSWLNIYLFLISKMWKSPQDFRQDLARPEYKTDGNKQKVLQKCLSSLVGPLHNVVTLITLIITIWACLL